MTPENARSQKAVTVFDVDDVFFPLNEHVSRIAGIDYDKIVTYRPMDNPILSMTEKQKLYSAYTTPHLHAHMDFYKEAWRFGHLARDPRLEPWLCSNSIDMDVVLNKKRNLRDYLEEDFDLFRQMFNVIGMEGSHTKRFPDNIWLLFDDSPLNAVISNARHILMPRRPWNVSDWGRGVLEPIKTRVQYYDDPADACGKALVLMDRELGQLVQ